jgi:hypothetical protein
MRLILLLFICFAGFNRLQAQIGSAANIGKTNIGSRYIQPSWIGISSLPKCSRQSACGTNPGCPVYTFIGKGDWNLPANWESGLMPPKILPACFSIRIKPLGDAPCILPTPQFLQPGSSFIVEPGKHIIIPGNVQQKD